MSREITYAEIAQILAPDEAPAAAAPQPEAPSATPSPVAASTLLSRRTEPKASPLAQRIAVDQGVDLDAVTGTGPSGRITGADVEQQLLRRPAHATAPPAAVRATPAARHLARRAALELAEVNGSGPGARIQAADVTAHLARSNAAVDSRPEPAVTPVAMPATTPAPVAGMAIPLRGARRTIAQRLAQSWQSAPHIFLSTTVDMTAAMD